MLVWPLQYQCEPAFLLSSSAKPVSHSVLGTREWLHRAGYFSPSSGTGDSLYMTVWSTSRHHITFYLGLNGQNYEFTRSTASSTSAWQAILRLTCHSRFPEVEGMSLKYWTILWWTDGKIIEGFISHMKTRVQYLYAFSQLQTGESVIQNWKALKCQIFKKKLVIIVKSTFVNQFNPS